MLTCALVAQKDTNVARAPLRVLTATVKTNLKKRAAKSSGNLLYSQGLGATY